jgi:predicted DCC family thiol-disulfide oxidoreductase YuxK
MSKWFNVKVDATGLSIFRIFYSLVLFFEILQLYKFRNIIYSKESFVTIGELDVSFIFYFWFIIIILLVLGLFTRFATIINYIFSVIIFSSAAKFEYHVFYVYVGINFLLMFMPIARILSLDNLLQKIKFSNIHKIYNVDSKILQVNYWMPVFAGIGLVYIDSVFHKLSSKMWMDGLGVWLPSSLPMVTWNDTSFLLNQEWLVKFLGYLVLVFETSFIFLFWFKKSRIPFFVLGVFFHIGILIAYPIPYFALTYIAIYLLLVPVSIWEKLAQKLKFKNALYTFYYDAECPLCHKVVIVIKHFDVFNTIKCQTVQDNYLNDKALKNLDQEVLLINIHGVNSKGIFFVGYWAYVQLFKSLLYTYPLGLLASIPGISYLGKKVYRYIAGNRLTERCTVDNCAIPVFNKPIAEDQDFLIKGLNQLSITKTFWKSILIIVMFGQILMIWYSPTIQNHFPKAVQINGLIKGFYEPTEWGYKKILGLTHHPVFMYDHHFNGYNHIFKIEAITSNGKKIVVPLLDEDGLVSNSYANGALWVNYTFRINNRNFDLENFKKGIIPYLKYYQCTNNQHIVEYTFYVKEIVTQEKWEKDFLRKQIAQPWNEVGTCKIEKGSTAFEWNNKVQEILEKEANKK